MADKKPYLTVNYEAMTFTVNDAEKPTAQDEADIARFLRAGFKMRHKSAKRTANATENAMKDADILKAFDNDKADEAKKDVAKNQTVVGVPAHKVDKTVAKPGEFSAYGTCSSDIDPILSQLERLEKQINELKKKN